MGIPKALPSSSFPKGKKAKQILVEHGANELIFAVVGHVGSGPGKIAESLKEILESSPGGSYETSIIKASDKIKEWAQSNGEAIPSKEKKLENVRQLQDLGDKMREKDQSAVARALINEIRQTRARKQKLEKIGDQAVTPDGKKRAYILESIRHPAEVHLLRNVYGASFTLIGVICDEEKCLSRVRDKYSDAGTDAAKKFMSRDAKDSINHGQKVADALLLSDFFIDNSVDRVELGKSPEDWMVNENLSRLVKIITHTHIVRPTISETAMFEAHAAALRSACLSRQVGACLVDAKGNVVAVGTNEVPKAGGGLYGENFDEGEPDERCAFTHTPHCRNTAEQNKIIGKIINDLREAVPELKGKSDDSLRELLRESPIGALLEFSRAVHAEMDALLTAGRKGVSTAGTRMWVTTFPCHYCARHIVSAGVDEVQYIEPYQKSKALDLHDDSVTLEPKDWIPPSKMNMTDNKKDEKERKVFFHHFIGVAPSMYRRAFSKDRDLKTNDGGLMKIGDAEWGSPWHLTRVSYVELEAVLAREKV